MSAVNLSHLFRRGRSGVRTAWDALEGLCFPPRCHGCDAGGIGDPDPAGEMSPGLTRWFCPECRRGAEGERIEAPFCAVCSAPGDGAVVGPGEFVCGDCRGQRFAFTRAVAARRSRGVVHDAVIRFKYRGDYGLRWPLAVWLGEALELSAQRDAGGLPDALIPVPLHPTRRRERGFNQAAVLARLTGRAAGVPVWETALRRVRPTEKQTTLSRDARQTNLRGAFAVPRPETVRGQRLLLVDDVFTTGATADECARTLRRAGAAEIGVIVVARR